MEHFGRFEHLDIVGQPAVDRHGHAFDGDAGLGIEMRYLALGVDTRIGPACTDQV
ncbi:MAG: hypothetical protein R3C45_12905 [Phycisphaerales bacterium]